MQVPSGVAVRVISTVLLPGLVADQAQNRPPMRFG
jgi:hypothetical protein